MSKIIILNREKAEIIRKDCHIPYEEENGKYVFEYTISLGKILKDLRDESAN